MMKAEEKTKPLKSMPVLYRAIGGSEYAAIITDVRPEGVSLMTFPPGGAGGLAVTSVRFVSPRLESDRPPFCYYALGQDGSDVLRK